MGLVTTTGAQLISALSPPPPPGRGERLGSELIIDHAYLMKPHKRP